MNSFRCLTKRWKRPWFGSTLDLLEQLNLKAALKIVDFLSKVPLPTLYPCKTYPGEAELCPVGFHSRALTARHDEFDVQAPGFTIFTRRCQLKAPGNHISPAVSPALVINHADEMKADSSVLNGVGIK